MRTVAGSAALDSPLVRPVVTVGNFDGVHLGHRAILDVVVRRAKDLAGEAVVYTFDPHPRKVLRPKDAPRLLTTLEQKLELLEEALHSMEQVIRSNYQILMRTMELLVSG